MTERKPSRYLISLMSFAVKGDLESEAPTLVNALPVAPPSVTHLHLLIFVR